MKTIVLIGTAFILGAIAGWLAKTGEANLFYTHYVPVFLTLLATYFGAKFAFDLQLDREKHEQKVKDIVSGNLAIFKLSDMLNSLMSYRDQTIDPVRDRPTLFLEMNATIPHVREHISIDLDSLSFLLRTDNKNILGEVARAVSKFNNAFASIDERSRVHRHEAQPLLAKADFVAGGLYSVEEIIVILGDPLYAILSNATDQVIDHVDSTIDSIGATATKLTSSLKEQFPNDQIISILPQSKQSGLAPI